MFLRSERLFLRPGWPEEWNEIVDKAASDGAAGIHDGLPGPQHDGGDAPWSPLPHERLLPRLVITMPGQGGARLIGCIGLAAVEAGPADLGFWILRECRGQGFATESVRALIGMARALGHTQLVAGHSADDQACARVMGKTGFVRLDESAVPGRPAQDTRTVNYAIRLITPNDSGDRPGTDRGGDERAGSGSNDRRAA